MRFEIEVERKEDGRWIAEMPEVPGVIVCGEDRASAIARAQALAACVLDERLKEGGVEYLKERARRGSRAQYAAALAEVPDAEPEAYDRLGEALSRLDPTEERTLAEKGLAADLEIWPDYADRRREDPEVQAGMQEGEVTARLNEIYGEQDSSLDAALGRAQRRSIEPDG